MTSTTMTTAKRIRALNDAFRRTFVGSMVMITAGVEAMPREQRRSLLQKVRAFDVFTDDNDPHGEHDFGAIDEGGVHAFMRERGGVALGVAEGFEGRHLHMVRTFGIKGAGSAVTDDGAGRGKGSVRAFAALRGLGFGGVVRGPAFALFGVEQAVVVALPEAYPVVAGT
jgi:hypothetical protein